MDTHIRIVAILHIIFGLLTLLAAGIVFVALGTIGGVVATQGEVESAGILGVLAVSVSGLLFFLSLPDIIGGWALLAGKCWGRILVIVLGFLNLLNLPFGTALGIYTLWALLRDQGSPSSSKQFA